MERGTEFLNPSLSFQRDLAFKGKEGFGIKIKKLGLGLLIAITEGKVGFWIGIR